MFKRITIHEAKKRFLADKAIYLCPCKMRPGMPWNTACLVYGKQYLVDAEDFRSNPTLWKGSVLATAWSLMMNNWLYYNASYECGYYAHYYVEIR